VAAGLDRSGPEAFQDLDGAFAIAAFDKATNRVLLARDRLGQRPLYFARAADGWVFASEIKGVLPFLASPVVGPKGLSEIVLYRWLADENALIDQVKSVRHSHFVELEIDRSEYEQRAHWSLSFSLAEDHSTVESWADRIDNALQGYFAGLRSRFDAIGIFLSSGIDSALLASYAARSGFRHLHAYTACFEGDEAEVGAARGLADDLGIRFHPVLVTDERVVDRFVGTLWRSEYIPRQLSIFAYDELLRASSADVPVVLDGNGADCLGGPGEARRLRQHQRRRQYLRAIPWSVRRILGQALTKMRASDRAARFAALLTIPAGEFLRTLDQIEHRPDGKRAFPGLLRDFRYADWYYDATLPLTEQFQRLHLNTFITSPHYFLDRLSRPRQIAVEFPFVSSGLIDASVARPARLVAGRETKPALRALASRHLPESWLLRPKEGFPTPALRWTRRIHDRYGSVLRDARTRDRGLIDPDVLSGLDPSLDWEAMWTALGLEYFCRLFVDGEAVESLSCDDRRRGRLT
jgi:asparagine synthase (glutamine-hydrolysing)